MVLVSCALNLQGSTCSKVFQQEVDFCQEEASADSGPEAEALIGNSRGTEFLGSPGTLEADIVAGPRNAEANKAAEMLGLMREFEVRVMPPYEVEFEIPRAWRPSKPVLVNCPLGDVAVVPPEHAQPGSQIRMLFAPAPYFRVRVPSGTTVGDAIQVTHEDGQQVIVEVPPDRMPGEFFDVFPPAIMAQVPRDARPGDLIVFQECKGSFCPWYRARLPADVLPGGVVPVRIPSPLLPDNSAL